MANDDYLAYTPGFNPWLSYNSGEGLSLYLSASLSIPYTSYDGNGKWKFTPELTRTSLGYRINQSVSIEAGRVIYADASGFAASGLFDGARFEMSLPFGKIGIGAYYSGLQFKETAKIIMSPQDGVDFAEPWAMDNFGFYFASARLLAAVRGDFFLMNNLGLTAEILAQFDANGQEESLNSQYGIVLLDFYPASTIKITAGGLFSLLQYGNETGTAIGALAQFKWNLPTPFNDQLGVFGKFTTGSDDSLNYFIPINAHSQGVVFPGTISGLISFGFNYDIRVTSFLYAEAGFKYFMRSYDVIGTGNQYGGEIAGSFVIQPFDDLRATIGGGVFLPGMGNHFEDGTDAMWKFSVGLIWAL